MNGKFNGVPELGKKLAGSAEVETCVTRQWFRFFLSRFEQDADNCSMKAILDAFEAQGGDFEHLAAGSRPDRRVFVSPPRELGDGTRDPRSTSRSSN